MNEFDKKKKPFGVGPVAPTTKPKEMTGVPDVSDLLVEKPPVASRRDWVIDRLGSRPLAHWLRSLDLPETVFSNFGANVWLSEAFRAGLSPEAFKKAVEDDVCPFCEDPKCYFTSSPEGLALGFGGARKRRVTG